MSIAINGLILSRLSGELIITCDEQMTVREANALARATLGERIMGRPLAQIIVTMARSKGAAFIDELRGLDDTRVTNTWELMLHVPRAAPLFAGLRGGRLPEGGWMIMGGGESSRLTSLYHEVLEINTELTNLIRELTREHAALARTVNRLLDRQDVRTLITATERTVAQRLAELRSTIVTQVADQLAANLPMIGLDPNDPCRGAQHHAQMASTAQRFHDLVQLGATTDWSLTGYEYAWASQALTSRGVTWDHQAFLIQTYFATVGRLAAWSDEERDILTQIAKHLYTDGSTAYHRGGSPPTST